MGHKIVVIDDDKKITLLLKKVLEESGHEVHTSNSGQEGLGLTKELLPDLLICDMHIPDLHGSEISRQIKESETFKDIKVILMTGVYKKISWLLELKDWADGFIEKPFDVFEILKMIDNVMKNIKDFRGKDGQ